MFEGGDIEFNDGRGGESIYGETFENEVLGFDYESNGPYILAMSNDGVDTNNSKFMLTLSVNVRHMRDHY